MDIVNTVAEFATLTGKPNIVVALFAADWALPCRSVSQLLTALMPANQNLVYAQINSESVSEATDKYGIESVPTVLFLHKGRVLDKVEGVNPAQLAQKVAKYNSEPVPTSEAKAAEPSTPVDPEAALKALNARLEQLVNRDPVMLFMKGEPQAPKCGFSRQIVDILNKNGIKFGFFDILTDNQVREGLRTFSNWPTYPQLYVKGDLVGGVDITKELHETGELLGMIPPEATTAYAKTQLESRLKALISSHPTMLFMKGSAERPQCKFSRKIVEILHANGVVYGTFDILQDEEVRQGLKEFSNWPTYPQLYHNGELVGGVDIVEEMAADGSLKEALAQ